VQVVAYRHGALVVDAWAGAADRATGRPADGDTLVTLWCAAKGVLATCVHLLAERGQLDYDAPVAHYWPAFEARGKARATVRHALTHRAGVPQIPPGTALADLPDWDRMCAAVADLAPLWPPGTQTAYHTWTMGWILGELVRRVDGRPVGQFLREEVCAPLGTPDLYFGIPDEVEPRVAAQELSPPLRRPARGRRGRRPAAPSGAGPAGHHPADGRPGPGQRRVASPWA
jgi:CubicO group peptidase (beta-lactamase class C family)